MAIALIISGFVLIWYSARELRKDKPNWPRVANNVLFWPLLPLFSWLFSEKDINK